MTKTMLQNNTTSVIVLKEGQAGILRKLCEIQPAGRPGDHYYVHSELNQTYKEYWCVSNNGNQFTLSSDDLSEWKAIVIKPTAADSKKFYWEGTSPRGQNNAKKKDPSTTGHASGTPPAHSSSWFKLLSNKLVGWFHKQKPAGTTPPATTTPATTTPATTTPATTTPATTTPATTTPVTTTPVTTTPATATLTPSTTATAP